MEKQYVDFAYVYDRLMEEVDYHQWVTYIETIFQREGLAPQNILELACGTGNITIPMAEKGYSIVGVDISEDMLMVAKEKAIAKGLELLLIQQDMGQLELQREYDAVLCFCDGVNYIIDPGDLLNMFQGVYRHMNDDGIFIFDISSAYKLEHVLGNNVFGENLDDLCYLWENYYDEDSKIIDMNLTFFTQEENLFRKFEEYHQQRAYEMAELVRFLNQIGFKGVQCYDAFGFKPPTPTSERIFFVCRK